MFIFLFDNFKNFFRKINFFEVISNYQQRMFLALAQHRGNEEDSNCLLENEKVLTSLFQRVHKRHIQKYTSMLLVWISKGNSLTIMASKVSWISFFHTVHAQSYRDTL